MDIETETASHILGICKGIERLRGIANSNTSDSWPALCALRELADRGESGLVPLRNLSFEIPKLTVTQRKHSSPRKFVIPTDGSRCEFLLNQIVKWLGPDRLDQSFTIKDLIQDQVFGEYIHYTGGRFDQGYHPAVGGLIKAQLVDKLETGIYKLSSHTIEYLKSRRQVEG